MTIDITPDDRTQLICAIAFLVLHHQEGMKEARRSAELFPRERKACLRVADHHQEQIYQAGELAVRLGSRNGWPRPTADVDMGSAR